MSARSGRRSSTRETGAESGSRRTKKILEHYERQSDEEAAAGIAAAPLAGPTSWVEVPTELVPKVRKLIEKHRATG